MTASKDWLQSWLLAEPEACALGAYRRTFQEQHIQAFLARQSLPKADSNWSRNIPPQAQISLRSSAAFLSLHGERAQRCL